MTEKEVVSSETKRKIIEVSRVLFSKYGYEGTSVRKIATESGVNVAAVNYHFKSKEFLFWEIILDSYLVTSQVVIEAKESSVGIVDMALKIFDHFHSQGDMVRNTMKLFLSEGMVPPQDSEVADQLQGTFGPPGGQYLAERIREEIPYNFTDEGLLWGVKAIFGSIVHWSMMCVASHIKQAACSNPLLTPEQIRRDVERMIRSTVEYMRNHPEIFDSK